MYKITKKNIIGLTLLGLILVAGIFVITKSSSPEKNTIQVAASFYPLYFFAEQIGGDLAHIVSITPLGVEPHDYEPSSRDIVTMENSDILLLNGKGTEPWGDNIKENINSSKTLVITVADTITNQQVIEEGVSITDPHIWLSPKLAKNMVDKIAEGFVTINPEHTQTYQANSLALKNTLDTLDQKYEQGLKNCKDNHIVTSHSAFGYLASAYGLQQISITGLSPDSEPSIKELTDIIKFAKEKKVTYIFFESLVSPKLSKTIATEIGAKTLVLNPIEGLTPSEISEGKNYVTIMEENLANLKIALQCQP